MDYLELNSVVLNEKQTSYFDLGLDKYPIEIQDNFITYTHEIPYIRNLISAQRKKAKDLERDADGKIIVDLMNPHILEDMDYFRQAAITYEKTGSYCPYRPNKNPNSEFFKFWATETERCLYGMVRDYDGEWIPGDYYFFLNYCPISRPKKDSRGVSVRQESFSAVWDGQYYLFHYLDQCRKEGVHAALLASRGKGKTFCGAAMLTKRFMFGESYEADNHVECFVTASDRKYIYGSKQILNAFEGYLTFCSKHTAFRTGWSKKNTQTLFWKSGYVNKKTKLDDGAQNTIMGISSSEDCSKLRGTRGALYLIEEAGCHIRGTKVRMYDRSVKNVEDIKIGDYIMGDDGTARKVLELYTGFDDMYKITLRNGDYQIVNSKHPVIYKKYSWNSRQYETCINTAPELMEMDISKGFSIEKAIINYPKQKVPLDPYMFGLWLGDGATALLAIANQEPEVLEYIENYCNSRKIYYHKYKLKQAKNCYTIRISNLSEEYKGMKKLGLIGHKYIPDCYQFNDEQSILSLIAGFIDTDGAYDKRRHIYEITQLETRKDLLYTLKNMCHSIGLKASISTRIAGPNNKKPGNLHYRLRISGNIEKIPILVKRKRPTQKSGYKNKLSWSNYSFKIEYYGKDNYYGFTLDGNHLFLLDDYTIVHNTFAHLKDTYNVILSSVEEDGNAFGMIYLYGTAGDKESDFSSMQEIMYHPRAYHIMELDNIYDLENKAPKKFTYFFPTFMNMSDCYDNDGNTDVTKALIETCKERYYTKMSTSDLSTVVKRVAEHPITPQEAILRTAGTKFPSNLCLERIATMDGNPELYDDIMVGDLVMQKNGEVKYIPSDEQPIRDYPLKDNKAAGAIEFYAMPERNANGHVPGNRYIGAVDPVDSEQSETMSLFSIFILDLMTDNIVCEWTGRLEYADFNYEKCRLIALFYNASLMYENNLKGIYSYFAKMNCLYLLADTPQYLSDKEYIKSAGYGNTSKGVRATQPINNHADDLTVKWLMQPVTIVNDEDEEITSLKLNFVMNRAFLRECVQYSPYGNFDRIRAFGILMIYREQVMIDIGGSYTSEEFLDSVAEDDFFVRNYDNRLKARYGI